MQGLCSRPHQLMQTAPNEICINKFGSEFDFGIQNGFHKPYIRPLGNTNEPCAMETQAI
jgi:hypothetical protein